LGCLVGSKLSENYGRRKCILVNNLFFVAGSLMCAFGNDKYILFIGRFITGFGFGIETVVVPVLLSEIARCIFV
jgi:MFS family permease